MFAVSIVARIGSKDFPKTSAKLRDRTLQKSQLSQLCVGEELSL